MKYPRLLAVLAVTEIVAKKPLMGGEAKVFLTESQIEKIENALTEKDTSALEQELASLKEENSQYQEEINGFRASVTQALTDNKLEASEDLNADISLLGKTCKKYGEKNNIHTCLNNDGKEKDDFSAVVDMNDVHNKSVS